VIPAYNQAVFLDAAIQSVLNQTYHEYEIIVVDDGSTDDTPAVAKRFGAAVRYIWQENQGLAAARNTGIDQACGDYVALLDADDEWLPAFLEQMVALAAEQPEAAVYYCGVQYVNRDGDLLPQPGQARIVAPGNMYMAMLRANFLIPSTVMMRCSVAQANLFDVAFRRLQDWELWVRLLRQGYQFAGRADSLVRYRIHDASLSTDPAGGQNAARALLEKHFGTDEGQWDTWAADKRRAYGGYYRYCALIASLIRQGDWRSCAAYLRKAFQIDPSLAIDLDLFYDLVFGAQPAGQRGDPRSVDLSQSARAINDLHHLIFQPPLPPGLANVQRQAYGTAYYALGLVAYNRGERSLSRRFLFKALCFRPELWFDRRLMSNLLKSLASAAVIEQMKILRTRLQL
jgi:glycosyltransferase involved in cell wall biosynthesis